VPELELDSVVPGRAEKQKSMLFLGSLPGSRECHKVSRSPLGAKKAFWLIQAVLPDAESVTKSAFGPKSADLASIRLYGTRREAAPAVRAGGFRRLRMTRSLGFG